MQKGMYVIKDELTSFRDAIMLFDNDSEAERTMKILVSDSTNMIALSPEDFSIYKIGYYDMETGTIIACTPEKIVGARGLVKNEV